MVKYMYEYVSKAEYKPYKEEIESIIKKVQKIMKTEYDTTFQFKLIGSANRHLVTKIKDGNRGYDFDYNLIMGQSQKTERAVYESFFQVAQRYKVRRTRRLHFFYYHKGC